jgi:opacity protein-like surface antigen
MKSMSNWASLIVPVVVLITGTHNTLAKSAIQNLTSSKKAESVQSNTTAASQIPKGLKKHSLGIGIGQTFVAGDFSDHGEDKITWDLLYNYSASHSFDLLTGFHYSKHEFKKSYTQLVGLTLGIKAKLIQFDAFSPYGMGGFGFYSPKVKREINGVMVESESKVAFGYHFGVGGDLRLNDRMTVGVLAQYHNPFDVKQEQGAEVEGRYYKLLITTFYTF